MEQFFAIDEKDFEARYNFCIEHDLIGCILGAFTFSESFNNNLLKNKNKGDFDD